MEKKIKETNICEIREFAKILLYLPYKETKTHFLVDHPVFTTKIYYDMVNGQLIHLDISDHNELKQAVSICENRIDSETDVFRLFRYIKKPYRLFMLKECKDYLSTKDLSKLLADCWIMSENPNTDINVSVQELEELFLSAEPVFMMSEEEMQTLNNLPDKITIYRGIGSESNTKGVSWSLDKSIAEWFSNRFQSDGYVLTGQINKSDVLAYFNKRHEKEIVVPYNKIIDVR